MYLTVLYLYPYSTYVFGGEGLGYFTVPRYTKYHKYFHAFTLRFSAARVHYSM